MIKIRVSMSGHNQDFLEGEYLLNDGENLLHLIKAIEENNVRSKKEGRFIKNKTTNIFVNYFLNRYGYYEGVGDDHLKDPLQEGDKIWVFLLSAWTSF